MVLESAKIADDIYSDGKIQISNVINSVLMVAAFANPVVGGAILVYGVLDYTFDISGAIDKKFGQIKIYDK